MAGIVSYGTAASPVSRMPSPIIWADCPVESFRASPDKGFHKFDDFQNSVLGVPHATDFISGVGQITGDINWYLYCESDKQADVVVQADENGSVLLETDGTDADVTCITTGGNKAGIMKTPAIGAPAKGLWFEARVKVVSVTDGDAGVFVGLAQPGEAKDGGGCMGADASSLADVDYIGFVQLSGDGDALKYCYNEATSGTAQSGAAKTIAADTWYRLGVKVDRQNGKVRFYVDGVDLGDSVAIDISKTNANFPSSTDMDVVIGFTADGTGADHDGIYVDWVRIAREY